MAAAAAGPATETSNRSARVRTIDLKGVTAPKEPIAPLGMKNDGPILTCGFPIQSSKSKHQILGEKGVTAPKEPIAELGLKNDGPILTCAGACASRV